MLSFKELSEKTSKKTTILINPKKKDLQEKNHGEDCDCPKCEKKCRSEDVNDGPNKAASEAKDRLLAKTKAKREAMKK